MFAALGLSPAACRCLDRLGYQTPTPIQSEAIPRALAGVDLLARAQTGTGKTAAFGLPMIDRLTKAQTGGPRRGPRGLVLVPTRELAVQVHAALVDYGAASGLRVAAIYGGVAMRGQLQALRRGVDIVVATPGRLIDHLERRTADLSAIEVLTLDEADRMLDMGFLPALREIVASLNPARQTLLFSATLSTAITRLASEFTRDAVRVDVSPKQVVATTVTHHVHHVPAERKREVLTHILAQPDAGQALVFCRTKRGADRVGEALEQRGLRTGVIHGNKSQGARSRALDQFKTGRVRVLVATDIAARGLDIVDLPLVVNFDLPLVAEDYVHRVGRTGRAGQQGRAVSLVTAADARLLKDIQRVVATPLERVSAPVAAAASVGHVANDAPAPTRRPQTHGDFQKRRAPHWHQRPHAFGRGRSRAGGRRGVSRGRSPVA